ncbi:MAG: hypothetical protein O0X93_01655 [Methanocorpusculum sp.]|nr:hypothetical protein [Methanocorpusculum sp.]MDE2521850.1 hypothetical protein [Methanocorpusculum sp.]MDE2524843.1 hypothetical protein [Methanocorpusculum sp.]
MIPVSKSTGVPRGFRQKIHDTRIMPILRTLAGSAEPLTAGEIGECVGLPADRVSRLLRTYVCAGTVIQQRVHLHGRGRRMKYELPPSIRTVVIAEAD